MTTPATLNIAVIEDDDTLRDLLASYLDRPGRRVFAIDCGEALNQVLAANGLDIVVLDLNLPYEDGLSIAQRLRRSHPHIKIVMLTARMRPADRTSGYGAGADVYLTKPTNVAELDAVIANLAQRGGMASPPAGFALNRRSRILSSPQRRHAVLTDAEALILEQLALAPIDGVESDTLVAHLRAQGNPQFSRHNLSVTMSRLRHKLESELNAESLIQTARNFGYRLGLAVSLD